MFIFTSQRLIGLQQVLQLLLCSSALAVGLGRQACVHVFALHVCAGCHVVRTSVYTTWHTLAVTCVIQFTGAYTDMIGDHSGVPVGAMLPAKRLSYLFAQQTVECN